MKYLTICCLLIPIKMDSYIASNKMYNLNTIDNLESVLIQCLGVYLLSDTLISTLIFIAIIKVVSLLVF